MKATRKNKRLGFTLVELLTVIAIMGILIAVLVPAVQEGLAIAARSAAQSNIRSIVQGYKMYAEGSGKMRNITEGSDPSKGQANSPATYAEVLARLAGITSGEVWYIDRDSSITGEIPANVLTQITTGTNQLQNTKPISWAVVVLASKNLDTNYPLAWTRGLGTDGKWKSDSPWKGKGGHIAFGDGHVRWSTNLQLPGDELVNLKTGSTTASYQEAVGENARVKEDT